SSFFAPTATSTLHPPSLHDALPIWMKNTYISLDMIFIRADGRILRIAENTEPLSTKIISSGGPAKGVLEVIAGTAQKYGIQPGEDRKSTRLNSSHGSISYAVFCLKT